MHILLVRFSSMGDVVLQTATVNWLRSLFPHDLRLTFVTSREFVSLIEGHPGIDHVLGFDRRQEDWSDFMKTLRAHDQKHPFDLILDLHATLRSFRLKWAFWGVPRLTVDKRRWERFFLVNVKIIAKRVLRNRAFGLEPQVERIIRDLQDIFGDHRGVSATRSFRSGKFEEMTGLPGLPAYDLPGKYIVLAPSASFEPKRWPIEYFVDLARELLEKTNEFVVVLAGPEDHFCQAFDELAHPRLINLQGKTSLKESMMILSRAQLSIGNDSGMNHIAEAYGVPAITIFGPTDPLFGFSPHGKRSAVLSVDLWCKPCSTTGKSPCFRKERYCMKMITVDEVLKKAQEALA